MKINVIKAFSGVFQCCWENIICPFFPARHKKFPSQLDKIGWFPSQEFRALSNPSIQNDRTKAIKPGQNRFFSASAITLTSRRMFVTTLWEREGVLFFFFFQSSSVFRVSTASSGWNARKSQWFPGKTSINNKISQPAHRNTCIFTSQQDSSGEQIMWGTDPLGAPEKWVIIPFFRCSKILGQAGKQEILQQIFQKF